MYNLDTKQKKTVIIIGIIVLVLIIIYLYNSKKIDNLQADDSILFADNQVTSNIEERREERREENEKIIIHITGAVRLPGIVKLEEGSRIEDAINKAGGLTEDADISKVNLAFVLEDGVKIKIPSNSDIGDLEEDIVNNGSGENILEDFENSSESTLLNINKATEQELQRLPGIGPSLASKIIKYRNEMGKFSNVEDIKNVNGIGENKFENIKNNISVK